MQQLLLNYQKPVALFESVQAAVRLCANETANKLRCKETSSTVFHNDSVRLLPDIKTASPQSKTPALPQAASQEICF
jgi:hypothetical protein